MHTIKTRPRLSSLVSLLLVLSGCASPDRTSPETVEAAIRRGNARTAPPAIQSQSKEQSGPSTPGTVAGSPSTQARGTLGRIATVNGQGIHRARMVDLLIESHGVGILDQLIGLETAKMRAASAGIHIDQEDIDREYTRMLRSLTDPLAVVTAGPLDRASAERLLDAVLRRRNLSRIEFDLVVRRNTFLRKVVESEIELTDAALHQEYERLHGSRVEIRHIQMATLREVQRVKALLASGEEFSKIAKTHSANKLSAESGGTLEPFSSADQRVPPLLRQTAFSLAPGERSDAIRVGEWYHIIQVERFFPAKQKSFESVRAELRESLRDRMSQSAIFVLFEKLFRGARIEIHDPALKRAFEQRHPDRKTR